MRKVFLCFIGILDDHLSCFLSDGNQVVSQGLNWHLYHIWSITLQTFVIIGNSLAFYRQADCISSIDFRVNWLKNLIWEPVVLPDWQWLSFLYEKAPAELRLGALIVQCHILAVVVDLVHKDVRRAIEHALLHRLFDCAHFVWKVRVVLPRERRSHLLLFLCQLHEFLLNQQRSFSQICVSPVDEGLDLADHLKRCGVNLLPLVFFQRFVWDWGIRFRSYHLYPLNLILIGYLLSSLLAVYGFQIRFYLNPLSSFFVELYKVLLISRFWGAELLDLDWNLNDILSRQHDAFHHFLADLFC